MCVLCASSLKKLSCINLDESIKQLPLLKRCFEALPELLTSRKKWEELRGFCHSKEIATRSALLASALFKEASAWQ
jgi:hypothetical protein